jgi:hypothetical protein
VSGNTALLYVTVSGNTALLYVTVSGNNALLYVTVSGNTALLYLSGAVIQSSDTPGQVNISRIWRDLRLSSRTL